MNRETELATGADCGPPNLAEAAPVALRKSFDSASLRRWTLAVFDQGVVSGTRFLTTIIVGRAAGPDELGQYSVAFTALMLFGCLQEALVTTPYAVHYHRLGRRSRAAYSGGSLVLHALVAAGAGLALLAVAAWIWARGGNPEVARLTLVVAATIPFSLMWEFSRRSMLAQLEVAAAARTDVTVAALQIFGLLSLALTNRLSAASALLVIAAGSLLVAVAWLNRTRRARVVRWRLVGKYWRRNWRLGKWLVGGQVVAALHGRVPTLLLALLVSASATGVFAAYLNFALITNPLILAVGNLLTPRAARAFSVEGIGAVVRLVRNAAMGMAGLLVLLVGTLALWGDRIVAVVYGAGYVGQSGVLVMLGACTVAWAVSTAYSCGLAALQYPRGSFLAALAGTGVSIVTMLVLVRERAVWGAAAGLLAGSAVAAVLHVAMFVRQYRALATQPQPQRHEVFQREAQRA